MARSKYYGLKGREAEAWQKKLNALGAGLKVDGVWGPKTEAAYQRLAGVSGKAYQPKGIRYIQYDAPTDEELRQQAENQGQELYAQRTGSARTNTVRRQEDLYRQLDRLEETYGDKAAAIAAAFSQKKKELSDYALSRGMARSSHALGLQKAALDEESASLQKALSEKQTQAEELQKSVDALSAALGDELSGLDAQRRSDIEAVLSRLKKERDRAVQDAIKYNNSLYMKQRDYELKLKKKK